MMVMTCMEVVQVVIFGSPNDPEASKHVVNACALLLSWSNHWSDAISRNRRGAEFLKAFCAIHHGPVRLQEDCLGACSHAGDMPPLLVTGPAMRQLQLLLGQAAHGSIAASPGMRRLVRDLGFGSLLHRNTLGGDYHAALQDGVPISACCISMLHLHVTCGNEHCSVAMH
jgi:hypothetical protein